ncbi:MAG: hypothetical protein CEE38_20370 [Planctomycetes bacterium B3_Pla]|nr:MAG: hypothetical protein CEE38_20370 [Planctomycetes bacterium B3_Pla]
MATFMVRITKCVKARIWVPITKQKIACCALLLASLTFYYQFLRTSHDFKGLVVDYMEDSSRGRSARVVLINNGTYYETLCDARLIYSRSKAFSDLVFVSGRNVDGPVVLRPGERMVCLVKDRSMPEEVLHGIEGSLKPLQGNMNTVLAKLDEEGKLPFRLYYGVLFEVAGSSGKVHKAWCFVGSIEVTKKYPLVFYSNAVNHTCDLLTETFAPGGTISGMFREN